MRLLKRFKLGRELSTLEEKARENPSPSTFIDLAQVYLNLGAPEEVLRVAEEGLLLFPQAAELLKLKRFARRQCFEAEVRDLRDKIGPGADAETYRRLASAYFGLGDDGAAEGVCRECLKQHPGDPETLYMLASAALRRFLRGLRAEDGMEALAQFLAVLEAAPEHAQAHRRLGEFLYQIGAHGQARKHLERFMASGEGDVTVKELLDRIGDTPAGDEDTTRLLYEVERSGRLPFRLDGRRAERGTTAMASPKTLEVIRKGLSRIIGLEGVQKAAYIRGSKALVKGAIHGGKDPFLKTVRVVSKAAQRAVRRMDLGNFSRGYVETGAGHICICNFGDVFAAVQCDEGASLETILQALQDLVAGSLFSMGEGGS